MDRISVAKAAAVARSAAARLAGMVGPDGRFLYRYMLPDPSITDAGYSPARHIGAVWGLIDLEREGWPIAGIGAAIDRAAAYMNENFFAPYAGAKMLCVVDEGLIKIGATALAVVATLALDRRAGSADNRDRAVRLARYIEAQRLADGDFVQMRVPGPIATAHPTRADFVTGQALLALAVAAEASGEAKWRALAIASAEKLARRDFGVGSQAHWMLYALEALWRRQPDPWILGYAGRLAAATPTSTAVRESTPIACQTEGLIAYARMLRAGDDDGDPAGEVIKRIARNLRVQLRFYHPSGAFIHSVAKPEVRIDTIRHNATGFLGYARLARSGRSTEPSQRRR